MAEEKWTTISMPRHLSDELAEHKKDPKEPLHGVVLRALESLVKDNQRKEKRRQQRKQKSLRETTKDIYPMDEEKVIGEEESIYPE